ncbi:hypothetical protein BpHYR1_008550 [Brachionus plicatilis]|uniref:Transmembrane protein n=1 Tax=Brachionus plicatilis TaxID=10195 RepID=A0A3M7PDM4_BRAPC|nr:hypothetical protein BpHYR1_008550 [Brachionus plicatilis]
MDFKHNQDEIDWSSMHNRIIPKEKLISLEQFYNLTILEKNNNKIETSHENEQISAELLSNSNKANKKAIKKNTFQNFFRFYLLVLKQTIAFKPKIRCSYQLLITRKIYAIFTKIFVGFLLVLAEFQNYAIFDRRDIKGLSI